MKRCQSATGYFHWVVGQIHYYFVLLKWFYLLYKRERFTYIMIGVFTNDNEKTLMELEVFVCIRFLLFYVGTHGLCVLFF